MIQDDMNSIDDDILIHPVKTKRDKDVPPCGILFVNPSEANKALAKIVSDGGVRYFLHNSQLAVSGDGEKFIAGPAIGAPAAALAMEKLIALGAKRILLMGWCGAIDSDYKIGDIVLPTGALSGEGTSRYYIGMNQAGPSIKGQKDIKAALAEKTLDSKEGVIWSTDAPYRESRSFLKKINTENHVIGVDMEFSALCNVASFRGIDFNAVMVVSDELWGENWIPGFKNPLFQKNCDAIVTTLLQINL